MHKILLKCAVGFGLFASTTCLDLFAQTNTLLKTSGLSSAGGVIQEGSIYLVAIVGQPSLIGQDIDGSDTLSFGLIYAFEDLSAFAITDTASKVDSTSVTLNGMVNANDLSTTVIFQYGTTISYGSQVTAGQSPVSGDSLLFVNVAVSGLLPGTTYHYRVVADNAGGTANGNDLTFFTYPNVISVDTSRSFPVRANASDYPATDYRIVGLPGASNLLANTFLSGQQNRDWQVYSDNGAASNFFVAFDGSATFQFSAGRAFWIINKGSVSFNIPSVQTARLNANQEIELPLPNSGWNLITNPFTSSIAWSKIQNANGNLSEPIWAFNGSFSQSPNFDPYVGYYFFNATNLSLLKIPYSEYFTPAAASRVDDPTGWRVNITLSLSEFSDGSTSFGIFSEASPKLDRFDFRKPRTILNVPTAFFRHHDWDTGYSIFASDIRPEIGNAENWEFEVHGVKQKTSQLSFSNVVRIPLEFAVYLINQSSGEATNLREDSVYNFVPASDIVKFRIVVGNEIDVEDETKSVLPKEFVLGKNCPNPFNPTTTIPVAIPVASEVKLKIYNVLGEEVKTIHDGSLEAGRYWFTWDAKDKADNNVASGVYFFRMTTSTGWRLITKAILMK